MKKIYWIIIILILITGIFFTIKSTLTPGKYDNFAKCLTDNKAKLYGAYWCSHCIDQKNTFGKSFKYITYIECSLPNNAGQNARCKEENIQSYPTWEFKDKSRITGELSFEELSKKTNCKL
ncbi:hypothetical protein CL618_02905 [archaeon]|nr:hypothetical protein [archaeon]|tara:strand:- start:3640 stop:4002 length:363 start_codon:yes stop_codon:yes gene_type:complete